MNIAGLYSGQTETPLSDEGREQARLAGEYAKTLRLDHIMASPYSRAHDTARIIAKAIDYPEDKIELNSLLIERAMGSLEGQPWMPDFNLDDIAEAETVDSLRHRVVLALEHINALPYENILVVSHGATARMFRHVLHPEVPFSTMDKEQAHANRFPNAEIRQLL